MFRFRKLLFFILLFPCCLLARPPFVLITVPKAGSHLVIKALHFLTDTCPVWHTNFPSFWCIPPDKGFLYTHFCLTNQLADNYRCLPELKKIILVRDLRDVALSMVGQIKKGHWPGMHKELRDHFLTLSFEEQLLFVINYEYDIHEVAALSPNSSQISLAKVAEQAAQYASDPKNLAIRYEDLVGPMGGGSEEAQRQTLYSIATFLQIDLAKEEIDAIVPLLYGDEQNPFGEPGLRNFRSTFSKGKIGSWKVAFTQQHKIAFKQKLGHFLIALGYEPDDNW